MTAVMLMFLMPLMAFAEDTSLSGAVSGEGNGILLLIGIGILALLLGSIFFIPYLTINFAKKKAMEKFQNDPNENAGLVVGAVSVGAGIVGVFIVFFFFGVIGSFLNKGATKIDLFEGTKYIASTYVAPILNKTLSGVGVATTP